MFTGTDAPRYSLNGTANEIINGTIFKDSSLPSTVDLWHETNRNLNARVIAAGTGIINTPDELYIGHWPSTSNFNYAGGESIGWDSEYSIVWKNRTVAAGSTLALNTMYGVTDPMQNPELQKIIGEPIMQSTAIYIHNGANKDENMLVDRYDCQTPALGTDNIKLTPIEEANRSLKDLDKAINTVSKFRANCGAQQNRLEHSQNNINTSKENLQIAESSIRDADMAKEVMELTKNNILTQAAQSMLAQANQLPQGELNLLR